MTRRLDWEDPRLKAFEARVVEARAVDGARSEVVLEATAFCPEAGGQPADRGELAGALVVGVREEGDRI
ncbi:MAG TPA: phosphoesterase, partial [Polyangia bacterium]|nr:phosphoesterase [Polyangia bacterium]